MFLSVFELFKIGIGPSSSHTMGPMTAAARFLEDVKREEWRRRPDDHVARITARLHGSLAYTGVGHGSDRAVILGLAGKTPLTVDPDEVEAIVQAVSASHLVRPSGHPAYVFDPATDLVLDKTTPLPGHANGMTFQGHDAEGRVLVEHVYYSIGGGFVLSEEELQAARSNKASATDQRAVPYPFRTAAEMLSMASESGLSIAAMKRANEETWMPRAELDAGLDAIWQAMSRCIERGLAQDGVIPGRLKVKRRARALHDKLVDDWRQNRSNPLLANDWLSIYAMAVNEENAAGGRVVTAPTNGAAGVVPAVMRYWLHFNAEADQRSIRDFLMTAAAIGGIIKSNASISGAEVGCQGEVGSAAAMAAAGLAALLGGSPAQVENAAEIALEHHLGMTCDPIGGLVQVPCIERNALGAVKAVTAASLAIKGDGTHFVPLDVAIETMRQTGMDMNEKYKETSLGGLAVNVVEC
ncbi:L-serine ammonia-lyase [Ancylobacter oerskovii]|uniref:L-serine dehydratase n=1 Tax=Ancylobacter oerskovii TaxID=459519 RepID=A0ABW4YTD3_9HYPH|nr:L-serine ammonia-lyase [Ancylobacter oerskovii]MBS7543266.1 L-serine ammonia-lyase [Ancylobacter oerskovii]